MNQQQLLPVFEAWQLDAVIWDGASAHRGKQMGKLDFERIQLPAYSPELNPAERIFEEVRREVEGTTYPSLLAKRHIIDQFLRRLRADRVRLKSLISWQWILDAHQQLPKT
jgi:transposase